MGKTMQLEQSVLQDVISLLDNKSALKKLQSYIQVLKKEESEEEMTAREKEEIMDDIREGLIEVKLSQAGKIKLQSAKDFLYEIRS